MIREINVQTGEETNREYSAEELAEIQEGVDAQAIINAMPLQKIHNLESQVTQRRIRDAIAGTDGGWLANQESLIAEQRSKL